MKKSSQVRLLPFYIVNFKENLVLGVFIITKIPRLTRKNIHRQSFQCCCVNDFLEGNKIITHCYLSPVCIWIRSGLVSLQKRKALCRVSLLSCSDDLVLWIYKMLPLSLSLFHSHFVLFNLLWLCWWWCLVTVKWRNTKMK